jgi:hypothetical protein
MTGILVVERLAVGSRGTRRLPKNLPWDIPGRDQLEQALQNAGLAIIAVENVGEAQERAVAVRGSDDKARLRAELEALVNEADESEFARLAAAVTASPDDGLNASTHPTALPSGGTGPPRGSTTTTPPTPRSSTRPADESSTSVRTWQPRHVKYSAMRASPPSAPTTGSPSSPQRRNWLAMSALSYQLVTVTNCAAAVALCVATARDGCRSTNLRRPNNGRERNSSFHSRSAQRRSILRWRMLATNVAQPISRPCDGSTTPLRAGEEQSGAAVSGPPA